MVLICILEISLRRASIENDNLEKMWKSHFQEYTLYRSNPEVHPEHESKKRSWYDSMTRLNLVCSRSQMDEQWLEYWKAKIEVMYNDTWNVKKNEYLSTRELSSQENDQSIQSVSDTHDQSKKAKIEHKKLPKISETDHIEINSSTIPDPAPASSNGTNVKIQEVMSLLFEISDRFGALAGSIQLLHKNILEAICTGKDPHEYIDGDAKLLLNVIKDKLDKLVNDESLPMYPKVIATEASNLLIIFLKSFQKKLEIPVFNIDLDVIARVTANKNSKEVVNFIRTALEYKQISNYTNDDIMQIYRTVRQKQRDQ